MDMKLKVFRTFRFSALVTAAVSAAAIVLSVPVAAADVASVDAATSSAVPTPRDASACAAPKYPLSALRDRDEGDVILWYSVSKEGRIVDIEPDAASAHGYIKRASYKSLRKCKLPEAAADSGRLKIKHTYELSFG
jgi:outer membrane biosynthesis protein TonB